MKIKKEHTKHSKTNKFLLLALACILSLIIFLGISLFNNENSQKSSASKNIESNFKSAELELKLTSENYNKIASKRKEALKKLLLFSSKEDLVDADLKIDQNPYSANIRLKGDLLDHLQNDRWSFRIQLKNKKKWREMSTFSIHNSKARSHLAEWVMHELFRDAEILTPAYDFLKVKLNGKSLGVYAYEQHFDNQLLVSNNKAIGPILRHNDDAYWENVLDNLDPFPWGDASQIELFNKENSKKEDFKTLFETGQSMLTDFINGNQPVKAIFDIDKIAKYYALMELSHAQHAQQFTNIRFYMNPHTGLLEPIGFDCFGDHLYDVTPGWKAMGEGLGNTRSWKLDGESANVYLYQFFQDRDFFEAYMRYLYKFSSPKFLKTKKSQLEASIIEREAFIKSDKQYENYSFSWDYLFKKASYTYKKILPRPHLSLKAYRINNSKEFIELQSYHYFPIEIVGFGSGFEMEEELEEPIFIESYDPKYPVSKHQVKSNISVKTIFFKTIGIDSIFSTELLKTNAPQEFSPIQPVSLDELKALSFLSVNGNVITFKPGEQSIGSPLIIPENYKVVIPAGTILKFESTASLISYSPIQALGSKEQPIIFSGENQKGNGIFISQCSEKSIFKDCVFSSLNSLSGRNILTEGGLSLYQSKVELNDCSFLDISAKDAISAYYSSIELNRCRFKNCKGDGIDLNYSTGVFRNVNFNDIGKDAIEITSGDLNAVGVQMENVLNLGLRANDNSSVYIFNLSMNNCHDGILAEEHAQLFLDKVKLQTVRIGVEIRSQNPPYTNAKISNFTSENLTQEYLLQKNASLTINGLEKVAK